MFTKDSRAESLLTMFGVEWRYTNKLTWDDLSSGWDVANHGRPGPARREGTIEAYATRAKTSSAPAPILWQRGDKYDPSDGVQRLCAAHKNQETEFSAYTFKTDSERLAKTIRVLANHLVQGDQETPKWNREQAVAVLAIEEKMSLQEIHDVTGWPLPGLEDEKEFQNWSHMIRCIGGPQHPQQMNRGMVHTIAIHAKASDLKAAPKPIAAFCHDLKRGKFTNGDAEPHIEQFFGKFPKQSRKNLHLVFEKRLEDFRNDPEVVTRLDGRPSSKLTPEMNLRGKLKSVRRVTQNILKARHQILYVEEYFQILRQIEKDLKAIQKFAAKG